MHSLGQFGFAAALSISVCLAGQDDPKAADVCAVLQDLSRSDGRAVAVRGEFIVGRHSAGLYGRNCTGAVDLSGKGWPWAIWVVFAPGAADENRELNSDAAKAANGPTTTIVTLVGRLESARHNRTYETPHGPIPMGFGPASGIFPARIVVTRVKDVRIEQNANPKK